MVKAFAMTQNGDETSLIVHLEDGHDTILTMDRESLRELVALSQSMLERQVQGDIAEMADENRQLQEAEQRWAEQRETERELDFSRQGYDDIPF